MLLIRYIDIIRTSITNKNEELEFLFFLFKIIININILNDHL